MFRHWTHYSNGKRSHLFIADRGRNAARPHARRSRCASLLASEARTSTRFSPDGKEVAYSCNLDKVRSHQHQQRRVCHPCGRWHSKATYHQSGQRWHANLFARREVHRLSLAIQRRIRERPLSPDAVRARNEQDHRLDAELRSLGRLGRVVAGFEDDLPHGRESGREPNLRSQHWPAQSLATGTNRRL